MPLALPLVLVLVSPIGISVWAQLHLQVSHLIFFSRLVVPSLSNLHKILTVGYLGLITSCRNVTK